jgi:hypothetical protein
MSHYTHSKTPEVLAYIRDNPGTTRGEIYHALPEVHSRGVLSNILRRLQLDHIIENRGGNTVKARWYAIEIPTTPYFLDIAGDLLEDLADTNFAIRKEYLAMRLAEIFDTPDIVVQTALSYTQTDTLTDAILTLLDVEIKRCADETCRKEFLFQEPLSEKRRPRNDARFCSDICERRTVDRNYKRRKRKKAKTS